MEQCDKCPKLFRDVKALKAHYRMAHMGDREESPPSSPQEVFQKPGQRNIQTNQYVCQACKGEVQEQENPCPHCGARLKWPGQGSQEGGFTCEGCGSQLRRGMKQCPGCGELIEWD